MAKKVLMEHANRLITVTVISHPRLSTSQCIIINAVIAKKI